MMEKHAEEKVEDQLWLNIQGICNHHHHDRFSWNDHGGKERMAILSIFVFVQVPLTVMKW